MDNKLRLKINAWTVSDKHDRVIKALEQIAPEKRDFEITSLLARAYNNLSKYETALNLLETIKEEGTEDTEWNFRVGYALYYLNRQREALPYFEKANELAPGDEDTLDMIRSCNSFWPFRKRVQDFWKWFVDNEEELSRIIENRGQIDSESAVEFVSKGTSLLGEDVHFNLGGNYEFSFSVEGNKHLFYLYPYVVSQAPEQLRGKWHFYPFNREEKGSFVFKMYGVEIDMARVQVALNYMKAKNTFSVRFYEEQLCALEEDQSYNAYSVMMNIMLGEGLAYLYITHVERADAPEKGMITLPELRASIEKTLKANDEPVYENPHEVFTGYRISYQDKSMFRYDVLAASSSFQPLVVEYYQGSTALFDSLNRFGAQAMFIAITYQNRKKSDVKRAEDFRLKFEEQLCDEVLVPDGLGILLGGAVGSTACYIDLLLYDKRTFIKKLINFLDQYLVTEYDFYLLDFYQGSGMYRLINDGADDFDY